MPLYNGIDTVSFATGGVYSETYGASNPNNIASLFASAGMLERATTVRAILFEITEGKLYAELTEETILKL
jgi:hypothetical protein